jgi:ketosteroid isomerase-like protein
MTHVGDQAVPTVGRIGIGRFNGRWRGDAFTTARWITVQHTTCVPNTEDSRMTDSEKRVRAFYDSLVPGYRERVCSLQSSQVVYELPEGMPTGGGRFEGAPDIPEILLPAFYGAFDVRIVAEEFIASGDQVVALGRLQGKTRSTGVPIDVPFAHVWTVRDGRLAHLRFYTDTAVLAEALGAADDGRA